MGGNSEQMPLVETLRASAARDHAPFYAPGHKQGQGIVPALKSLLGAAVFRADLPELPELDNLFAPEGAILAAQELAAAAFGAEQTWFLANGSTCGIEAAILAVCGPGQKIIVPRNAHQSVISGLILSGATPVFVMPDYAPDQDLVYGVAPETVATALEQHPQAQAVLLVSPTYQGICSDVAAIAALTQARHIPLIIDEAHGPHFAFHPELPPTALSAGADLVVQSTHKVLGALTQASMLHVQGARIDRQRLSRALVLTQSTSPSYLLLASLDAARQQMVQCGQALLEPVLALARQLRQQIAALPPLTTLTPPPGLLLDPTRLTLEVGALGWRGFAVDEWFHTQLGVTAELPTLRHLTFILSIGNTPADAQRLGTACQRLRQEPPPAHPLESIHIHPPFPQPQLAGSPREAFFASPQTVPIKQAVGRVSTELICPYPPGIPVLLPGEVITADAIAYLLQVQHCGGRITGNSDPTLGTLQVLP